MILFAGLEEFRQKTIFNQQTPDLAMDNDPSTCAKSGWDVGPWWKLDLGQPTQVSGVSILGETLKEVK